MRRPLIATFALVTTLLAACGSHDSHSSDTSAGSATTVAAGAAGTTSAAADADDIEFAQSMIGHHEQAIVMAEMALDPKAGAGAPVQDLAKRIKAAQDPEITQMKAWLTKVGAPTQMDANGHDMSSMPGMMSADDMDALGKQTGASFDKAWLDMMIAHHAGAVTMSETVKSKGSDAELRALADKIISAQQQEITEMKGLGGA